MTKIAKNDRSENDEVSKRDRENFWYGNGATADRPWSPQKFNEWRHQISKKDRQHQKQDDSRDLGDHPENYKHRKMMKMTRRTARVDGPEFSTAALAAVAAASLVSCLVTVVP